MFARATGNVSENCCNRRSKGTRTRQSAVWFAGLLLIILLPLQGRAQTFEPSFTVGAGIQTSYDHTAPSGSASTDMFSLNHARIYLGGTITKNVSAMFNTDYDSVTNKIGILDAAAQFSAGPKFNVWIGRFLPPSDRANLYGPFYANEWAVYSDGIQDGYPFVFQGRDNGVMYWGDYKAGIAKIKAAIGAFDGKSATGIPTVLGGARLQIDLWDPEEGYYLNGTYYGDKNLLAIAGATEWQSGKTATTVDFLLEKKVLNGGAVTVESEFSDYNRLGGYNANYLKSDGAYGLASFLIPKEVGIGKFEVLGKFAAAQFTNGIIVGGKTSPRFHQDTTEVDVSYVIKQFDARIMSFYKDTTFNRVQKNFWELGVGVQLQLSKTIH
jgi:hypothetical protein